MLVRQRSPRFTGECEAAVVGLLDQTVYQQRIECPVPLRGVGQPSGVELGTCDGDSLPRSTSSSLPRT